MIAPMGAADIPIADAYDTSPYRKPPRLSLGGGRQPDSVTLGQWLGRHKNKVIDAMWFAQDTSPKDAIKWYVDTASPDDL